VHANEHTNVHSDAAVNPTDAEPPPALSAADTQACVGHFFPQDTFAGVISFDEFCAETSIRKGEALLSTLIERGAAGAATEGLRVWSSMNWYKLAIASMVREKCCPAAAQLVIDDVGTGCTSFSEVIDKTSHGRCTSEGAKERAMVMEDAVRCFVSNNLSHSYQFQSPVKVQERSAFEGYLQQLPDDLCGR
jgi:hypothetical protein